MKVFSIIACAMIMFVAGTADATTNCTEKRQLKFVSFDTAGVLWQSNRHDSPLDTGTSRLMVHVLHQDGAPPYDYVNAFAECTGIEGRTLGQVRNLSFDFLNTSNLVSHPVHVSGGSPRYSVDLDTDGDNVYDFSAFLGAGHCEEVIPANPAWSRADFTGRITAGCSIFVGAEQFTSDGAKSAWKLFAEAHPTWKVLDAYLVVDEDGTTFLDRLAFHNRMFNAAGTSTSAIKTCASESSC